MTKITKAGSHNLEGIFYRRVSNRCLLLSFFLSLSLSLSLSHCLARSQTQTSSCTLSLIFLSHHPPMFKCTLSHVFTDSSPSTLFSHHSSLSSSLFHSLSPPLSQIVFFPHFPSRSLTLLASPSFFLSLSLSLL